MNDRLLGAQGLSLLIGLLVLGLGCRSEAAAPRAADALPVYRTASLVPEWLEAGDAAPDHRVPDFAFTDQDGRRITNADTDGRVYVASFFYARCGGLCPTLRSNLARVQDAYRGDPGVLILSHTVLPAQDSVAALRAYAAVNGVESRTWHLLTGDREALYALARDGYFAEVADDAFLHTETFVLVDGDRRIRGVYDGTLGYDVDRLIEDIAVLRAAG